MTVENYCVSTAAQYLHVQVFKISTLAITYMIDVGEIAILPTSTVVCGAPVQLQATTATAALALPTLQTYGAQASGASPSL